MRLCIIGVPARCATHQSGFKLLVSNGIKEALMTTALTDRIVARYMREAQQRHAEQLAQRACWRASRHIEARTV